MASHTNPRLRCRANRRMWELLPPFTGRPCATRAGTPVPSQGMVGSAACAAQRRGRTSRKASASTSGFRCDCDCRVSLAAAVEAYPPSTSAFVLAQPIRRSAAKPTNCADEAAAHGAQPIVQGAASRPGQAVAGVKRLGEGSEMLLDTAPE